MAMPMPEHTPQTRRTTGITSSDNDMEYCAELSRRAVARAALHLGIESISGDTLNILGDVLISYLERVGRVLANNVEASKRSSAHVNVLDTLYATEVCTAPGAMNQPSSSYSQLGWENLATFLFGKDWMLDRPNYDDNNTLGQRNEGTSDMKVYSTNSMNGVTSTGDISAATTQSDNENQGWNAPFFEDVSDFPVRTSKQNNTERSFIFLDIAKEVEVCRSGNPSKLVGKDENINHSQSSGISGEESKTTTKPTGDFESQILSNLSDDLFYQNRVTSFWGSNDAIVNSNRINNENEGVVGKDKKNSSDSTAKTGMDNASNEISGADNDSKKRKANAASVKNKKVKFETTTTENDERTASTAGDVSTNRPGFLPSFLPNFPPEYTYRSHRNKTDTTLSNENVRQPLAFDESDAKAVRGSLVTLERGVRSKFWGSEWIDDTAAFRDNAKVKHSMIVPTSISSSVGDSKKHVAIEPVGRQSSVRVSRILEGSLDIAS